MATASAPRPRGAALGIVSQATLLGAWLFGVTGAVGNSSVGYAGAVFGVVGLVLMSVACFLLRSSWGVFGPLAGVILAASIPAAIITFFASPGRGVWAELGSFIIAVGVLTGGFVVGHLVASIGLVRARRFALGAAAVAVEAATAIVLITSVFSGGELWAVACAGLIAGNVLLLIGLVSMRA